MADGGRGFDLGRLARVAVAAAIAVAAGHLVLSLLLDLLVGGGFDPLDTILNDAIDVIGRTGFIGAIVAVVVLGPSEGLIVRGAVAVWALQLVDVILSSTVNAILAGFRPGIGLNLLFSPLFTVITFLGIVIAYRLFKGQTALPWVDVRL